MWKWLRAELWAKVWPKVWAKVRGVVQRVFLVAFVAIWTAVGASLYAMGHPDSEVFWLFYAAVWVWYAVTVVLPDLRRRRAG